MFNSSLSDTAIFEAVRPDKPSVIEGTLKLNATAELLKGKSSVLEANFADPALLRIEISFASVRDTMSKEEIYPLAAKVINWIGRPSKDGEQKSRSVSFVDLSPEVCRDLKTKHLDRFINVPEVAEETPARHEAPVRVATQPRNSGRVTGYEILTTPQVDFTVLVEGKSAVICPKRPCPSGEDLEKALSGVGHGLDSIEMKLGSGPLAVGYSRKLTPLLMERLSENGQLTIRLDPAVPGKDGQPASSTVSLCGKNASFAFAGKSLTIPDLTLAENAIGAGKEMIEVDLTACGQLLGTEASSLALWSLRLTPNGKLIINYAPDSSVAEALDQIPSSMMKKCELRAVENRT